ncbi:MAG: polyphosphate kinase 1 [Treponema sp.]|nr:polyphosphate kinase 1 [Treponema sp.]
MKEYETQDDNTQNDSSPDEVSPVFFDRGISWVDFNERVLGEGLRKSLPPLERLKYLSIVSSNFDEFFMVRVSTLKRAREHDGPELNSEELLGRINSKVRSILSRQFHALIDEVIPGLAEGGLRFLRPNEWSDTEKIFLEAFFVKEIYPLLTPLRLEDDDPLPTIDNHSLHAGFLISYEKTGEECISILRIPQMPDRIIWLPSDVESGISCWALLEDLVQVFGSYLYPGFKIKESLIFKVNRDANYSIDDQRDEDFIEALEEVLEGRDRSMPVRMVYTPGSKKIRDCLAEKLDLDDDELFQVTGPMNLEIIYEQLRGFDHLREKPWRIYAHPDFPEDLPLWDRISQKDIILHLPYQAFDPVVRFFKEAAADPSVAAIKTTLYRTSGDSPIVSALEQASMAGKHVTAVVEVKARFDEGRNISWANRLEKAGVIVIYGLARLKVHAKLTIVMRREFERIKRYVHISTGNYNDKTAKTYEDIALFTAREDMAYDAGLLFNMITGYSAPQSMTRLVIAPTTLKQRLLELISREINRSSPEAPGKIIAKMNGLADPELIKALYKASRAGVRVSLIIRGICMLVPGVKGLSENIQVISVVDHYLEHSRIYYFANGGAEEIYLASADWMPRNLERRVELMFPVLQDDLRKLMFDNLQAYLQDNTNAWVLSSTGSWRRKEPASGENPFRAQVYLHSRASKANTEEHSAAVQAEFVVRRSPPGKS